MAEAGRRYRDKVVVITGGSKGIGEGCVRVFVRHGAKVVFCARGEERGKSLESEMNQCGPGEAMFVKADVNQEDDIKNLVDKTMERYNKIDCLINNAGTHPPFSSIDGFTADDFRKMFEVNVVSYFLSAKFALPHLRLTHGNIINISSSIEGIGHIGAVTYVSSKGAVNAMTRALAVDEAKHNVRVNTLSPGNTWTPLWESLAESTGNKEEAVKTGRDAQALGRLGSTDEIGLACLFLAADATYSTGINLMVSGGSELNFRW